MHSTPPINRRTFIQTASVASAFLGAGFSHGAPAGEPGFKGKMKLGIDNFAVRALGWNAPQLIDYSASLKTDVLFITDLKPFEKRDDGYLRDLSKSAADKGALFVERVESILTKEGADFYARHAKGDEKAKDRGK